MSKKKILLHVDGFSALDELPKKQRGDPLAVKEVLRKVGRFSFFEIDTLLAGSLKILEATGQMKYKQSPYPWTYVDIFNNDKKEGGG